MVYLVRLNLQGFILMHCINDILNNTVQSRQAQDELSKVVENEGFTDSIQDPHAATSVSLREVRLKAHHSKIQHQTYSLRWIRDLAMVDGDSLRQYCLPPSIVFLRYSSSCSGLMRRVSMKKLT